MFLSIVVPMYNEEASVRPLYEAVVKAVTPLDFPFEILLVDDGSSDGTFDQAYQIAREDTRLRVIKLNKNFGQTTALYAGFEQAQGELIVTMDGDLQNDPADIGMIIGKMEEGYDVLVGWRADRQDYFFSRKLPSRIANWLVRKVMGVHIRDNGCAMRAYRAEVIKGFPLYSEMHRLLPTILALTGARIAEMEVRHHPRKYGTSKYGISRIYKVLFDLVALKTVMTFSQWPFFGFGIFATLSAFFSALSFAGGVVQLMIEPDSPIVIYIGLSILWGTLSFSLLMLGILCDLIYSKGNQKMEHLIKTYAT